MYVLNTKLNKTKFNAKKVLFMPWQFVMEIKGKVCPTQYKRVSETPSTTLQKGNIDGCKMFYVFYLHMREKSQLMQKEFRVDH